MSNVGVYLFSTTDNAQQGGGDLISKINGWKATLLLVSRSVISVGAIGGGVYTYFKVQSDDGGSGKKAIGNFALFIGLLFVLWVFTELFLS